MKILLLITLTSITIWLTSCGGNNSYMENRSKSPEELKTELKQQELNNPLSYLTDHNVTLQPKEKKVKNGGLFSDPEYAPDGGIIEGDIINKAVLAKFKDIVVKVSFYSQTKTLIEEKSYVIYKYYEPHSTKHFLLKIDVLPQAYKNFSFEVTGAKPANE